MRRLSFATYASLDILISWTHHEQHSESDSGVHSCRAQNIVAKMPSQWKPSRHETDMARVIEMASFH